MSGYVELHCHSEFSLLDGASPPAALVERAAELGMTALALTDHDAVYGAVQFVQAARAAGIQPILGAELTLEGDHHLTLLVENQTGWANLCGLITQARHHAPKGEACLPFALLDGHADGLIALSGCRSGHIPSALRRKDKHKALDYVQQYMDLFGKERFWIELQHHRRPGDDSLNRALVALAEQAGLGYVATNNVHYARRESHALQDVLVSIRHKQTLDEAAHLHRPNSEYYLKSADEMARLFTHYPQALANTLRIAERCRFDLRYGLQDLPQFPTPDGLSADAYLRQLCVDSLRRRLPEAPSRYVEQLERELTVIAHSGLANYFLVVWDIVRFAQTHGVLCQGRGSAANSLVAYLLHISPVDPIKHDLVFERFLSDERQLAPDIDIDFQADRREEVIQYIYDRYGRDHAAMACTFVTFRSRSAVRDVGKRFDLPPERLDRAADAADYRDGNSQEFRSLFVGRSRQHIEELTEQIVSLPRHLGIHNGGMVITGPPLSNYVPTEPATMAERTVVQWDKDSLEDIGLIKIDILGLRMLSAIAEARDLIQANTVQPLDLNALTFDDRAIYAMISSGDTVGVFQVESRAQAQMLPRFQPRRFEDLIVAISLIRPGPIMGDMVHPYLRRRLGEEAVTYPHELLKDALQETLGVILFQEQVLKVARDLAGFTPGQGELLRRALGAKDATAEIERFHDAFIIGAQTKGVTAEKAEEVFDKLRAFGGYSFPKSHAAAFAVLVYWSAWLKRYYPAVFYVGLLNNQPMGFWSPAVVLNDAKRHRIPILPVDVNLSAGRCTLEGQQLRIGLNVVKRMGEHHIERVLAARMPGPFTNLKDFCQRTQLAKRLVENLILSGAMDAWNPNRRRLLWQLGSLHYRENELDLDFPDDEVSLPEFSHLETLNREYLMLGLSLHEHPLARYRKWLDREGILNSKAVNRCPVNRVVRVAGLNVVHQAPPTAKGHHFVTLEDEEGFINVILRPKVYARFRQVVRQAPFLIVEGTVQRAGSVTNLLAVYVETIEFQIVCEVLK